MECTFVDLNDGDRDAFGPYATGEQMVLRRSWDQNDPSKTSMTGRGRALPEFDEVRAKEGKALTAAYKQLRESRTDLGLEAVTNVPAVKQAMLTWEQNNPTRCEIVEDQDASPVFGYDAVGKAKLLNRFLFVFVPGIKDAAAETIEKKGSLLDQLLTAIADQRSAATSEAKAIRDEARAQYKDKVEKTHRPFLDELGTSVTEKFRQYVPTGSITFDIAGADVTLNPPVVHLRGGEGRDSTTIGRQGHGFQRAFIIAVLEYLAEASRDESPENSSAPTLFLAIEEPELYQHPPRARHLANVMTELSQKSSVQVSYATHSPYFASPAQFDAIRLVRRDFAAGETMGTSITSADFEQLRRRLPNPNIPDPGFRS